MEDELRYILSKLSVCDLNMVMYCPNGDCERAANTISQLPHDKMGLPAEMLGRSLRSYNSAVYDNNKNRPSARWINPRQLGRVVTSSSSNPSVVDRQMENRGTYHCQAPTRRDPALAYSPPPYALVPMTPHSLKNRERFNAKADRSLYSAERYDDRWSVSSGQAHGFRDCDNTFLPPAKSGDCEGGFSSESGQPPYRRPSSSSKDDVSISLVSHSRTDDLLQRLSPNEKDKLLRQFLTTPKKLDRQRRQEDKASIPRSKNTISIAKEMEALKTQAGLWLSFEEEKEKASIRDIDDEALKIGMRVSKQEFRQLCRRQDEDSATGGLFRKRDHETRYPVKQPRIVKKSK
mmetsp:Transcript_20931/g.45417  ORF Transcript_20931/g.45417 Transcript_20931/m.45417 type:complete len:347 (+) Transcript_20931:203-1243(+)